MVADYSAFRIGAFQSPLDTSLSLTLLQKCDLGIFEAICFYSSVIETHLGDAWRTELVALGHWNATDGYTLGDSPDGYLIAQATTIDPAPYFLERNWRFPLLALSRDGGTMRTKSIGGTYRNEGHWTLDYILPPMSALHAESLKPILMGILGVIQNATAQGYDPSYDDGRLVWDDAMLEGAPCLGNYRIDAPFRKINDGNESGAGINFEALTISIDVSEQMLPTDGIYTFENLEGIDGYVSVAVVDEE